MYFMSKEERKLLHEWVKNSNSPYENGDYVCDDNCQPMDFVNTLRFWEDIRKCYNQLPIEERRSIQGENETLVLVSHSEFDENGFQLPTDLLEEIEKEVYFL